jgi:hypothetical protein
MDFSSAYCYLRLGSDIPLSTQSNELYVSINQFRL